MLLHLVRQIFPNVKAVFSNTGLEYASIQRHVRKYHNVDIIVPPMRFDQVISTYGYPLISKEVAEAIYYARRIRSQNGNVKRERERERAEHTAQAQRTARAAGTCRRRDNLHPGLQNGYKIGGGGRQTFRVRPRIKKPPDKRILSSRRALRGTDEPS